MRIAVLEDDPHIGKLIGLWLASAGHDYELFARGDAILRALSRETFDLLVLDRLLPDMTGDEVLQWAREHIDWPIPAIFVTTQDSEDDIVSGLMHGADDYLVKPVRRNELLARISALARRARLSDASQNLLEIPPFRLDAASHSVVRDNKHIELTHKEFELIWFLFHNVGRVLSRGHILQSVWGHNPDLTTRTVDTHVSRIRTKLGLNPQTGWRLYAIYNHGYRLEQLRTEEAA